VARLGGAAAAAARARHLGQKCGTICRGCGVAIRCRAGPIAGRIGRERVAQARPPQRHVCAAALPERVPGGFGPLGTCSVHVIVQGGLRASDGAAPTALGKRAAARWSTAVGRHFEGDGRRVLVPNARPPGAAKRSSRRRGTAGHSPRSTTLSCSAASPPPPVPCFEPPSCKQHSLTGRHGSCVAFIHLRLRCGNECTAARWGIHLLRALRVVRPWCPSSPREPYRRTTAAHAILSHAVYTTHSSISARSLPELGGGDPSWRNRAEHSALREPGCAGAPRPPRANGAAPRRPLMENDVQKVAEHLGGRCGAPARRDGSSCLRAALESARAARRRRARARAWCSVQGVRACLYTGMHAHTSMQLRRLRARVRARESRERRLWDRHPPTSPTPANTCHNTQGGAGAPPSHGKLGPAGSGLRPAGEQVFKVRSSVAHRRSPARAALAGCDTASSVSPLHSPSLLDAGWHTAPWLLCSTSGHAAAPAPTSRS
jgi:hypothetical protein